MGFTDTIRGDQCKVRISVDGVPMEGSFLAIAENSQNELSEVIEEELTGESQPNYDISHKGYELSIKFMERAGDIIDLLDRIKFAHDQGARLPDIKVSIFRKYKNPDLLNLREVYHSCIMYGGNRSQAQGELVGIDTTLRAAKKTTRRYS